MGRFDKLTKLFNSAPEAQGARSVVEGPHSIFSVENGMHQAEDLMPKLTTDETVEVLRDAGLSPRVVEGKYGGKENSILVPNPTKEADEFMNEMARSTGQESVIKSANGKHKLEYTLGDKKGQYHEGQGTTFYDKEPEDFYTKINGENGTPEYFSHNIDFSKTINPSAPRFNKLKTAGVAGIATGGVGSQFIDPAEATKQAYGLYKDYVQEPISKIADKMSDKLVSAVNPVGMPNREKIMEQQKPAVKFGGEMIMDPLNAVGPMSKAPAAIGAGMLARKEAAKIFNVALKRAAEEGKPIGKVVSEMLLGKMPWAPDAKSAGNLAMQREMMRDVSGHALMEKHGISDGKGIAAAVREGVEKTAPGFPQDKIWMVNPVGDTVISPDSKTLLSLSGNGTSNHVGSLATGMGTGDIKGLSLRTDRLPERSQTAHQILGLAGHELGHANDAAKYGLGKHVLEKNVDPSVFNVAGGTIDSRLDRASRMHHIDSPNQTFEKTMIDRIAGDQKLFPDLQQPIPKFISDQAEAAKLEKLIQERPELREELLQGMQLFDKNNPKRFGTLQKLLKPR